MCIDPFKTVFEQQMFVKNMGIFLNIEYLSLIVFGILRSQS